MFKKIKNEIKFYNRLYRFSTNLLYGILIILLFFIFKNFITNIIYNNYITSKITNNINTIASPRIYFLDKKGLDLNIIASKCIILDKNHYKFYNASIKNDKINSFSKILDLYKDKNEIVMSERPYIVYDLATNNKENE